MVIVGWLLFVGGIGVGELGDEGLEEKCQMEKLGNRWENVVLPFVQLASNGSCNPLGNYVRLGL